MNIKQIQSNKLSSKRTRERVRAHGPEFEVIEWRADVSALGGQTAWLVESTKDKWKGWLPELEITIIN